MMCSGVGGLIPGLSDWMLSSGGAVFVQSGYGSRDQDFCMLCMLGSVVGCVLEFGTGYWLCLAPVLGCVQGFGVNMGIGLRTRFLPIGHLKSPSRSNRSAYSVVDLIATSDLIGESIPSCRPFS